MVYTDIKIGNNTKVNHMMVSFIDHYNAISMDRFLSKTKIGKKFMINDSLLLRKRVTHEFSSAAKTFLFLLKTNTFQQVTGGNTPNVVLK